MRNPSAMSKTKFTKCHSYRSVERGAGRAGRALWRPSGPPTAKQGHPEQSALDTGFWRSQRKETS